MERVAARASRGKVRTVGLQVKLSIIRICAKHNNRMAAQALETIFLILCIFIRIHIVKFHYFDDFLTKESNAAPKFPGLASSRVSDCPAWISLGDINFIIISRLSEPPPLPELSFEAERLKSA